MLQGGHRQFVTAPVPPCLYVDFVCLLAGIAGRGASAPVFFVPLAGAVKEPLLNLHFGFAFDVSPFALGLAAPHAVDRRWKLDRIVQAFLSDGARGITWVAACCGPTVADCFGGSSVSAWLRHEQLGVKTLAFRLFYPSSGYRRFP
jgi:hypothetical protein